MRKLINIPQDLKEAVDLFRDALNLSYVNSDTIIRRHTNLKKKDFNKEFSFSATLCFLVQSGIDKQHEINKPIDPSLWINKQDVIKFKELIEAAYQKSLDFSIDSPHRNKMVK